MAELRQRKAAEPQNTAPISADARSLDPAAKRPRKSNKESGLLLFATPLILILHIALVSTTHAVVFLFFEAGHLCDLGRAKSVFDVGGL